MQIYLVISTCGGVSSVTQSKCAEVTCSWYKFGNIIEMAANGPKAANLCSSYGNDRNKQNGGKTASLAT